MLNQIKRIHYAQSLRSSALSDEPDLAVLPGLVKAGDVCIDMGANVGVVTRHLSKLVGPTGRVLAIEPMHDTFGFLSYNVRRLGLKNVEVANCALSSREGFALMETKSWPDGGENYYRAHIVKTGGGNIRTRTVDELCSSFTRLDFIKCDVEGHEAQMLAGARQTIAKFHPKWLIETDADSEAFIELLEHGYECYVEFDGRLIKRTGEKRINYFFL